MSRSAAVRAWALSEEYLTGKPRARGFPRWRPYLILVFDTETMSDLAQGLLFGAARIYQVTWTSSGPVLCCIAEIVFYPDDLHTTRPDEYAILKAYARNEIPDLDIEPTVGKRNELLLLTCTEFLEELYRVIIRGGGTLVAFNLPFDVSRIAADWGVSRKSRSHGSRSGGSERGAFSLVMWQHNGKPNPYRPRLVINRFDSKRARFTWGNPHPDGEAVKWSQSQLLDLRTLAFALSDISYSLKNACEAFQVVEGKTDFHGFGTITKEHIDYCRSDVRATANLYVALMCDFIRHPVHLDPAHAYSPASLAKAYLAEFGITEPRMRDNTVSNDDNAIAMEAYYGGRSESRIRLWFVPCVPLDYKSNYATVNILIGTQEMLCAEKLEVFDEAPERAQQFLDKVTIDKVLNPDVWREDLRAYVLIQRDGDILPTRMKYDGQNWGIGVTPGRSQIGIWVTMLDAVASRLMNGKSPKVLATKRINPIGRLANLKPVSIYGVAPVDLKTDDLFQKLVELRQTLGSDPTLSPEERKRHERNFKVLGNSVYGMFVELNPQRLQKNETAPVTVFGEKTFQADVSSPETPGRYCMPVIASLITGGARLLLAIVEALVAERGGTYAFTDTDAMAVVALPDGGLVPCPNGYATMPDGQSAVRALSWAEVEEIRCRINKLNPYDRSIIPELLKIEKVNFDEFGTRRILYAYSIAAKRYALMAQTPDGDWQIVAGTEHGLGHLMNPGKPEIKSNDWIREGWEWLVHNAAS